MQSFNKKRLLSECFVYGVLIAEVVVLAALIVVTAVKLKDHKGPSEYSGNFYDDLFVFCYIVDHEEYEGFMIRDYYYRAPTDGAVPVNIGQNFGFGIEDHCVDIDGDGASDIVCNRVYGGDGVEELFVIAKHKNKILHGYVDMERLALPDLYYFGAGAFRSKYDVNTNDIEIIYMAGESNDDMEWKTIHVGPEYITYAEFITLDQYTVTSPKPVYIVSD